MKLLPYFLFFALLAISCKQAPVEENAVEQATEDAPGNELASMEAQVMALHDEVMPKMQDISKILATLRSYKENASETPEGKIDYPHFTCRTNYRR